MDWWLINFLNGISSGLILFLIAVGLSLVLGVMGILNLAHGGFFMIGAYIGVTAAAYTGNFLLGVLAGGFGAGLVGLTTERLCLRRLYKQLNEQVLLTLGLIYIFTNIALWIWGPWPKMGMSPALLSGKIPIGGYSFPVYRLALIIIGLVLAVGLWLFQEKTRAGAIVRAGMDDKEMVGGLGINYGLISSIVFFVAIFVAGLAGFIGAPVLGAYLGAGFDILLFAMIIAVVGGVGTVQGALVGGLLIGLLDSFGKTLFPNIAMFTMYLVLIVVLLGRPTGLLGRKRI